MIEIGGLLLVAGAGLEHLADLPARWVGGYLAEYDYRYNYRLKNGFDDTERADALLLVVAGKRLTYQRAN